MKHLGMSYSINKRNKMAKGGMACAHGGPAYCNKGCYSEGGMVEEPMHEKAEMPASLKEDSMDSLDSMTKGRSYEVMKEDPMHDPEEMKMAKGGMFHPKQMAKMIVHHMAKGGMVNSAESWDAGQKQSDMMEDHPAGSMDNEDIDLAWTTPHDDNLSSEGEYPLIEEEGYEEGHQAKMRRKGGVLERVMSKIHSR